MEPEAALTLHNEFSMLNLADLLLARERNHVELIRKKHVVGTAVGLYLIRKKEPWKPIDPTKRGKRGPRTLGNSEVRDYSWPCILAFVDEWKAEEELDWQDRVPPSVYLDERRRALERWADHVVATVTGIPKRVASEQQGTIKFSGPRMA